jgi:TolB protein
MPSWSPDGTRIAFASERATHGKPEKGGDYFKIWVINPDGTNPVVLTSKSKGNDTEPSWSPLENKIAFVSDRDGTNEIYRMNADGSNQIALTTGSGYGGSSTPSWSPDGSKIAFSSADGGWSSTSHEIYVMDSAGGGRVQLTSNYSFDGQPGWSPDGATIVFASGRTGNMEIWAMDSDGTRQRRLTFSSASNEHPRWVH